MLWHRFYCSPFYSITISMIRFYILSYFHSINFTLTPFTQHSTAQHRAHSPRKRINMFGNQSNYFSNAFNSIHPAIPFNECFFIAFYLLRFRLLNFKTVHLINPKCICAVCTVSAGTTVDREMMMRMLELFFIFMFFKYIFSSPDYVHISSKSFRFIAITNTIIATDRNLCMHSLTFVRSLQ